MNTQELRKLAHTCFLPCRRRAQSKTLCTSAGSQSGMFCGSTPTTRCANLTTSLVPSAKPAFHGLQSSDTVCYLAARAHAALLSACMASGSML